MRGGRPQPGDLRLARGERERAGGLCGRLRGRGAGPPPDALDLLPLRRGDPRRGERRGRAPQRGRRGRAQARSEAGLRPRARRRSPPALRRGLLPGDRPEGRGRSGRGFPHAGRSARDRRPLQEALLDRTGRGRAARKGGRVRDRGRREPHRTPGDRHGARRARRSRPPFARRAARAASAPLGHGQRRHKGPPRMVSRAGAAVRGRCAARPSRRGQPCRGGQPPSGSGVGRLSGLGLGLGGFQPPEPRFEIAGLAAILRPPSPRRPRRKMHLGAGARLGHGLSNRRVPAGADVPRFVRRTGAGIFGRPSGGLGPRLRRLARPRRTPRRRSRCTPEWSKS